MCPAVIETGSLPADQHPDSEMNYRISGIICPGPADRVFQSEQDTGLFTGSSKIMTKKEIDANRKQVGKNAGLLFIILLP